MSQAVEIDSLSSSPIEFSICTLVTNEKEYAEMKASFKAAGFSEPFCEYLYIDNSVKNKYDAYKGINKFLNQASGKYIILCHQDILLNLDDLSKLNLCIAEINKLDPQWAILSNAGGSNLKKTVFRIAYPDGKILNTGPFPSKVQSVDENFILVKNTANLALSADLTGYHLYGTDLCRISSLLGYSAYVIDFLLTHKSYGSPGEDFFKQKEQFIAKYRRAYRGTYIRTTITPFYLSGCRLKSILYNSAPIIKLAKLYWKLKNGLNN